MMDSWKVVLKLCHTILSLLLSELSKDYLKTKISHNIFIIMPQKCEWILNELIYEHLPLTEHPAFKHLGGKKISVGWMASNITKNGPIIQEEKKGQINLNIKCNRNKPLRLNMEKLLKKWWSEVSDWSQFCNILVSRSTWRMIALKQACSWVMERE